MSKAKIYVSTNTFGKAYLVNAWEARGELLEYERRGFAQFFYLTISGHIESVIMSCIKARLKMIISINWSEAGEYEFELNNKVQTYSIKPIIASIKKMANSMLREVESAPLSKLLQLYNEIFPDNIGSVIGNEHKKDLDALACLRNLFAHGRDLFIEFEEKFPDDLKGTLDGNPLKYPAQRLHSAGIIKNFDITTKNHHLFTSLFFSDEAMLYFYKIIREVESKLKLENTFVPENMLQFIQELPELQL